MSSRHGRCEEKPGKTSITNKEKEEEIKNKNEY